VFSDLPNLVQIWRPDGRGRKSRTVKRKLEIGVHKRRSPVLFDDGNRRTVRRFGSNLTGGRGIYCFASLPVSKISCVRNAGNLFSNFLQNKTEKAIRILGCLPPVVYLGNVCLSFLFRIWLGVCNTSDFSSLLSPLFGRT